MNLIDAEQYKILKREFERIQPALKKLGLRLDADGAWARAMLLFVPVFLFHLERERKVRATPRDVFEGMVNLYADLIRHTVRTTMGPASRANAFDVLMRNVDTRVRPKLSRTDGGIILPGEG